MEELLENPEKLEEMGKRGRHFVEERYAWDVLTDRLIDAYQEGIERNRTNRSFL
jgi:glycosyltransferase involved in cell wall biosynthesis